MLLNTTFAVYDPLLVVLGRPFVSLRLPKTIGEEAWDASGLLFDVQNVRGASTQG